MFKPKPDLEYLSLVDWRYFGTLTFKGEKSNRVKELMFFAFIREACSRSGGYFPRLLWVRRSERGELFGRHHYHFLIGGGDVKRCNLGVCFSMMNDWEKLGGGLARVELYDQRLAGLDYMLKALSGERAYETGKFDMSISELTLSHSLFKFSVRRVQGKGGCSCVGPVWPASGGFLADNSGRCGSPQAAPALEPSAVNVPGDNGSKLRLASSPV